RAALPLRLRDGPRLGVAVTRGGHLGRRQLALDARDRRSRKDFGEDDVAFDFEVPNLIRARQLAEIGGVEIHESDFFFGFDRRNVDGIHGINPAGETRNTNHNTLESKTVQFRKNYTIWPRICTRYAEILCNHGIEAKIRTSQTVAPTEQRGRLLTGE